MDKELKYFVKPSFEEPLVLAKRDSKGVYRYKNENGWVKDDSLIRMVFNYTDPLAQEEITEEQVQELLDKNIRFA